MRVLVACEYSGRVRDAFIRNGHDAISCDLLASDRPGPHYQGDVRDILDDGFDLMVAHPPCTDLAVSGNAHRAAKLADGRVQAGLEFVHLLMDAPIPRICIENPVSVISSMIRKPDQCIQPWQFGHGETKKTCLWLTGLPDLMPTDIVAGRLQTVANMPQSANRWKLRSLTYQGIADAMGDQWGTLGAPVFQTLALF